MKDISDYKTFLDISYFIFHHWFSIIKFLSIGWNIQCTQYFCLEVHFGIENYADSFGLKSMWVRLDCLCLWLLNLDIQAHKFVIYFWMSTKSNSRGICVRK